jgi:ACS family glucarate transporter-like MFS transporter
MFQKRYLVYFGIFLLMAFNYVDRVSLSVAAPSLSKDFGLSSVELGYLFSAFLAPYIVCMIPWGFLMDRYGARRMNAIGVALWSISTVLTGFVWSYATALTMRLLMGAAEASSLSAGTRALREWAPRKEYGLATSMMSTGTYFGPAIGLLLISWVVSMSSWRMGFIVAGLLGFAWLAAQLIWFRNPEQATFLDEEERQFILRERDAERPAQGDAGFGGLLRSRSLWAVAVAHGCAAYTQLLFLTWLPSYLATERHLSIMSTGLFTTLPYVIAAFGTWGLGLLSDRLLRGVDTNAGKRRWMVCVAMLGASVVLLAPLVDSVFMILVLITISLTSMATAMSLNMALSSDLLQSPADAGKTIGFYLTISNVGGLSAPIATGYIIAYTGSYNWAFTAGGILLIIAAIITMTLTYSPIGVLRGARTVLEPSMPSRT